MHLVGFHYKNIQCVPLAAKPGISLIILPLMRILQRLQTDITDTLLFISHTTNVLLFKFRYCIFIDVRIIKEMPGSVASGTPCIMMHGPLNVKICKRITFLLLRLHMYCWSTQPKHVASNDETNECVCQYCCCS